MYIACWVRPKSIHNFVSDPDSISVFDFISVYNSCRRSLPFVNFQVSKFWLIKRIKRAFKFGKSFQFSNVEVQVESLNLKFDRIAYRRFENQSNRKVYRLKFILLKVSRLNDFHSKEPSEWSLLNVEQNWRFNKQMVSFLKFIISLYSFVQVAPFW